MYLLLIILKLIFYAENNIFLNKFYFQYFLNISWTEVITLIKVSISCTPFVFKCRISDVRYSRRLYLMRTKHYERILTIIMILPEFNTKEYIKLKLTLYSKISSTIDRGYQTIKTNLRNINWDNFYVFFLGWWLSMDPKDSFLKKIQPIRDIASLMDRKNRFQSGTESIKTLGSIIVSGFYCTLVL